MNGNFEDKLTQLAFGELSPEEARRFEKEVQNDPAALRALHLYQEMKEDLRGLSVVPEDQFSKERLRDAILTQGLKPVAHRPASNRGWFWMPVAACALGFGFIFLRNLEARANLVPVVNIGQSVAEHKSLIKEGGMPLVAINTPKATSGLIGPLMPNVRDANSSSRHGSRHKLEVGEIDPRIQTYAYGLGNDDEGSDFPVFDETDMAKLPSTKPATRAPSSVVNSAAASGPIVLIDQDKDEQTGAQKATEVGSASNVLVGG